LIQWLGRVINNARRIQMLRFFRASLKKGCSVKAVRKTSHPWRVMVGLLVFTLYCLSYSPVGISLVILVGSFDSCHEARLQSGEQGLQLVLHHGHRCIGHHHGLVARTLTLFAQPATPGNPDHVIQFRSTNNYCSQTQLPSPTLPQMELPAPAATKISIAVSNPNLIVSTSPRPPPYECGLLACLHSTVFLI